MLCHHLWSPLQHHSWMCLTRKTLLLGPAQPASSLRPLLFVPGLEVARWRNRSLSLLLSFPASSAPQEASVPMKHPRSQTAGGWAQRGPRLAAATLPSGPLRSPATPSLLSHLERQLKESAGLRADLPYWPGPEVHPWLSPPTPAEHFNNRRICCGSDSPEPRHGGSSVPSRMPDAREAREQGRAGAALAPQAGGDECPLLQVHQPRARTGRLTQEGGSRGLPGGRFPLA